MFSWAYLGLVVIGGAVGTAVRAALSLALGDALGALLVPAVNLVGAFALGALVGVLTRRPASTATRAAQQLLGTGLLGGFTTYSALAVESADAAHLWLGLASAVAGTGAAWGGLLVGRGGRAAR